jgi:hypothetical protein
MDSARKEHMKMRVGFCHTGAFQTSIRFVEASLSIEARHYAAQAELQDQLASLLHQQSQEYTAQREAQIREVGARLNRNELEQMVCGFETLIDFRDAYAKRSKIPNPGVVKRN